MQRNFIVTTTRSGLTLITPGPIREPNREFAGSLKSRRKAFRMAVTYADFANNQPIYQCRAAGSGVNAYQLAVADYMEKPKILDIDLRGWGRGVGEEIRIRAKDNFIVLRVHLVILDEECVLEEGDAVQSEADPLLWTYTIKTGIAREPGLCLDAYAYDIPRNVGTFGVVLR